MIDLIHWFKSLVPATAAASSACDGFVYVPRDDPSPLFSSMKPNVRVGSFTDTPPWIVVDHSPQSVVLAKWPGRLWAVRILRRAPEQPCAYAGYTRATAVHVLNEVQCGELFEHCGTAVVEFLDRISSLTERDVEKLGLARDEDAAHIHGLVWDRWIQKVDPSSPLLGNDHTGIIAIGSKVPRSPVGNAPSVLHSQLSRRARQMVGDDAFVTEDEEVCFNPTWATVAANLQHALFSVGVEDQLLKSIERAVLARVYEEAILRGDA